MIDIMGSKLYTDETTKEYRYSNNTVEKGNTLMSIMSINQYDFRPYYEQWKEHYV